MAIGTARPHEELRSLLADEIMPTHRERWGDSHEWEALVDFQRQLGKHGWTAPAWPVEIGGRGLDVEELVACEAVFHELGAPTRVAVYGVNNVGPTIAAVGTPEQKEHLRAIAEVDELWCQGFSEPDHGSDLAGLQCRAERDGDEFVVNGQKIWTSIGLGATHCMLLVRTDPVAPKHRGISALLVPLDLPGIERRAIVQITGEREFAELFFTDVRVPTTALLGPENEGWRVTMTTLGYERSGILSMAGSIASDAEHLIAELGRGRGLHGPILQRAMAVYSRARLLRITGQRSLATEGDVPGPLSTLIKQEFAALMKDVAALAVDTAGPSGQLHDGPGATRDFLRSPATGIAGGTTEVLKNLIGERVLGLPKEPQAAGS